MLTPAQKRFPAQALLPQLMQITEVLARGFYDDS